MKKFTSIVVLLLALNLVAAAYVTPSPEVIQPMSGEVAQQSGEVSEVAEGYFQDGGYSEVLDRMGIPHRTITPDMPPVDLADWPEDGALNGPRPKRMTGERAGLPTNALPGARFISIEEAREMAVAEQRRGGLYLVDIDFVPRELPEALKAKGLTLGRDGALLDRNEEPVVAFITSEVYLMDPDYEERSQASPLSLLVDGIVDAFVPVAEAAYPFPWACYSFTPSAWYHGGFHRWYEADTWVAAYGPDGGGGCSWASPHTNIDYLQARAAVGGVGAYRHCFYCAVKHAHDEWDVGYFWPAHGVPVTTHSGIWADGSFSFSRTAHLTW
ncbi:MAG: hypothetical protein ACE5LU_03075 [Anaerolineae bacterium]